MISYDIILIGQYWGPEPLAESQFGGHSDTCRLGHTIFRDFGLGHGLELTKTFGLFQRVSFNKVAQNDARWPISKE